MTIVRAAADRGGASATEQRSEHRYHGPVSCHRPIRKPLAMIRVEDGWRDAEAWNSFVASHPQARYCQLFGYGRVVACYGYQPRYLGFLRNRDLVGILPAAEVSSILYGRRLISQPFSEYGGMLLHPDLSDEEVQAAVGALCDYLGERSRASSLELHGNHGLDLAPGKPADACRDGRAYRVHGTDVRY